jgi:hypothetical protein
MRHVSKRGCESDCLASRKPRGCVAEGRRRLAEISAVEEEKALRTTVPRESLKLFPFSRSAKIGNVKF